MTSHNNRFPMLFMKCQFMMKVWCVVVSVADPMRNVS